MNVSTNSYHICILYIILVASVVAVLRLSSLLLFILLVNFSYSTYSILLYNSSFKKLTSRFFFALFSLPCSLFDAPILRFDPASISGSSQVVST